MAEPGRPRAERRTRAVRAYEETAEMMSWILELEGKGETTADFIESLIRREVENRFAPLSKRVEAIKAAYAGDTESHPVASHELGGGA